MACSLGSGPAGRAEPAGRAGSAPWPRGMGGSRAQPGLAAGTQHWFLLIVLLPATMWRLLPPSHRPGVPSPAGGGGGPAQDWKPSWKARWGRAVACAFSSVNTLPAAGTLRTGVRHRDRPGPQVAGAGSSQVFSSEAPYFRSANKVHLFIY